MLPMELMGPGGSLSTVLIATPYWRDASRKVSWQAAMAAAAYSCDRTTTAASPSAGKRLAAVAAEQTGFVGDGF
jgi:hypothetical protein